MFDDRLVMGDVERVFFEAGYACFTKVHPYLCHRCGYVAVPESHPLYCCPDYWCDDIDRVTVHGGVTYFEKDGGCCIIGFDTAHLGDAPDQSLRTDGGELDSYFDIVCRGHVWTADDAERETRRLARELRSIEDGAKVD